jgi:hypothetical protein
VTQSVGRTELAEQRGTCACIKCVARKWTEWMALKRHMSYCAYYKIICQHTLPLVAAAGPRQIQVACCERAFSTPQTAEPLAILPKK